MGLKLRSLVFLLKSFMLWAYKVYHQRSKTWIYLMSNRQNNGRLSLLLKRLYTFLYLFTQKLEVPLPMSPPSECLSVTCPSRLMWKGVKSHPQNLTPCPPGPLCLRGHVKLYQPLPFPHENSFVITWKGSYKSYFQTLIFLKLFSSFP